MAALLRRSRHIWEGSKLLGSALQPAQHAPRFSTFQASPISAAKVSRGKKKEQTPETASVKATDEASTGELGDGSNTPNKPKRSPSAYSQYQKEQFAALKADATGKIVVGEASKDIAARWKSLTDEQKQPYLTQAVAAKMTHREANPKKGKAKVPSKTNGYRLFIKENFEAVKARNAAIGAKEVMTAMGHEWKSKSQADRDSYNAKADEYNRSLSQL